MARCASSLARVALLATLALPGSLAFSTSSLLRAPSRNLAQGRQAPRSAGRAGGVRMELRGKYIPSPNWTLEAAEVQGRNPEFILPKQLPVNIQIRTCERMAEAPYAEGLMGVMQKASPGDYGPDMEGVWKLAKEVGGKTDGDILQNRMTDQGYRSYIIAEDTDRGEIVGCCQLNRVQVGGYLYLTEDLIIKNFYVNKDYRGYGIGNNLVHEALLRLKPSERAWAIVTKKTPEFNFFFSSGFVGLLWQECAKVFPGIVWVLLWPFHGKRLSMGPDCVFLACEGRGGTDAFNPAG